jgi:hypothetical protein
VDDQGFKTILRDVEGNVILKFEELVKALKEAIGGD